MTSTCFKTAMAALGYDDIRTTWIRLPNIARINITTNANPDGSVIGVTLILDVSEITSIETRNAMSASMFVGNEY